MDHTVFLPEWKLLKLLRRIWFSMRTKKCLAPMCTSCFAVALGKSGHRNVTPHCAVKGFFPVSFYFQRTSGNRYSLKLFLCYRISFPLKYVARILHLHLDTNGVTVVKSVTGNLLTKGQLFSEWIYEVIVSPKKRTKNCQDFCPVLWEQKSWRFLLVFWEKRWVHKFILKSTDL